MEFKVKLKPMGKMRTNYNKCWRMLRAGKNYHQVTIDEERWASSESTIVAMELLDSMGQVVDITEDASRSGFATRP